MSVTSFSFLSRILMLNRTRNGESCDKTASSSCQPAESRGMSGGDLLNMKSNAIDCICFDVMEDTISARYDEG